jgi:hypothetical protein
VWEYEDLVGRKLSATHQILLEVISGVISILGGREKVHLGHLVPDVDRAGMLKAVMYVCTC